MARVSFLGGGKEVSLYCTASRLAYNEYWGIFPQE
jgi:hypothetical protein